ncbi:MAG: sugar phosphate isomerase/epimerase [Defluviitaleaceae bacterium]|nr:sugar phosphate isomerase/epimerase [Defluviitaleaceae bacterium]
MPTFGASIYSISRKIISGEMSPADGIKWLADNGAEAIELVPFGIDMVNEPVLIDTLLEAAKKANVPIINYSLNANFLQITTEEYAAELSRVKTHIDIANKLNLPTIRIDCAGYRRPIETNTIENFQQELPMILDTYRTLCDYASRYHITVLLENHGFHINGADRIRQIMTSIDRPNFGHQLDTGNYECVDDRAESAVDRLLPFATTIHVKDFYIRTRDPGDATQFDCSGSWFRSSGGRFLRGSILGQGDLDIYRILNSIKKSGYSGHILVEFEGMEDCLYGTRVSLDNLKRIYQSI